MEWNDLIWQICLIIVTPVSQLLFLLLFAFFKYLLGTEENQILYVNFFLYSIFDFLIGDQFFGIFL